MKKSSPASRTLLAATLGLSAFTSFVLAATAPAAAPAAASTPAAAAAKPYKILQTTQVNPAPGNNIDYVTADSVNRRVYVACGSVVSVFDLDTYKLVGSLPNATGHGVALDPENHTGLVSGANAVFFNTKTLEVLKTIPARGADGYLFDALTHHFFILSHSAPNLQVFDSKDGSVVGTVDAIGPNGANAQVEQGATDGEGHLFFDCSNVVAVVDAKTLKVTAHYDLGPSGGGAAGLAIDAKNHILFAMCRGGGGSGPTCVILSSVDGKIITTLPLAGGSDGGGFNPNTMEAFSSTGSPGALSIIKEKSPTEFVLEDTVTTKSGAKTCTLDAKLDHIIVITMEAAPAPVAAAGSASASAPAASASAPVASASPAAASGSASAPAGSAGPVASAPRGGGRAGGGRAGGGRGGPQVLDVIFVGR